MRGMGWGVPMLVAGLGIPIVLLALWGWRIAGDVTTGLTVRVDRAASEGTANLPTLLTADMVLVTNGPRPLTSSPPAPVNGPSISPSPARPGWHCCFSSLNPAPIRRDSPRVNLSYMQRAPRPECDARFARAGGYRSGAAAEAGDYPSTSATHLAASRFKLRRQRLLNSLMTGPAVGLIPSVLRQKRGRLFI